MINLKTDRRPQGAFSEQKGILDEKNSKTNERLDVYLP